MENKELEDYVRYWQNLTGEDFNKIDASKTIVMVTSSPMEVHGPHLPVGTDNFEAEGLSGRVIEKLRAMRPRLLFLRLPTLYIACDTVPQRGSLTFGTSTIYRVMADLGRTLSKQGFKDIWVASFHGGPRHFIAIERACHRTNRKYGARMVSVFSLLIKKLTDGSADLSDVLSHIEGINPGDLKGDTHAGLVETSMMLNLMGELVRPGYKQLPRKTVDLKLEKEGKRPKPLQSGKVSIPDILRGFKAALEYFEVETYSGKPDGASEQIGDEILDILSSVCAETLAEVLKGEIPPEERHSPMWPMRWLFSQQWLSAVFEKAIGYKNPIF